MKRNFLYRLLSVVALILFLPQLLFAASVLQVSAEPGISIWLNNNLVGETQKEENGLLITDLAPGNYVIKAGRHGYDTVETNITVENNQTLEWRIRLGKPAIRVEDSVKRIESTLFQSKPTGTIVLKSIPLNAEIFFNGESLGLTNKKLTYVPAATHEVRFVLQQWVLAEKISLQPDESILLLADFIEEKIVRESTQIDSKLGPAVIKMQTARKRKPALFPHRKHQEMYGCANCHHGMDTEGRQVAYMEGMAIQHCVTCHNAKMKNTKLNSLMLAAHTRCKGCHKKVVAESGTAGPIAKCNGCHISEVKE